MAGPGEARSGDRAWGLVADLHGQAGARGTGQVDVDLGAGGVLAGVGQGLLHDPGGGAAGQVGHGAADLVAQGHPNPGPARLGRQLLDIGQGRLGQLADGGAQDPDDLTQVLEGLVGVLADHLGGPGDLPGGGVGAELERARVDAQQRQPVAEDIVHLPGDLVAGALLGLLGPQLGLGLGPLGPVPQRQHQLAPVVDEQAPADGGGLDDHPDQEQDHRVDPRFGPDDHIDQRGQHAQPEHPRRGPRWPVDRDSEHRQHHGPGHEL
jgi:hypothetical protein